MLTRLDLSFNRLFGPIPVKLAEAPLLRIFYVRNNSLSGNEPAGNWTLTSSINSNLLNRLIDDWENKELIWTLTNAALLRLSDEFQYQNNPGLCGVGFASWEFALILMTRIEINLKLLHRFWWVREYSYTRISKPPHKLQPNTML